mmetsp:Transcript_16353/g.21248  ORF Transcript_16353/g.21248 Transcript_16353/m.21248 type:complete len:435 (+) Transcript_16353:223-1527(+)
MNFTSTLVFFFFFYETHGFLDALHGKFQPTPISKLSQNEAYQFHHIPLSSQRLDISKQRTTTSALHSSKKQLSDETKVVETSSQNDFLESEFGGLLTEEDLKLFEEEEDKNDKQVIAGLQLFVTTLIFSTNSAAIRYLYSVVEEHPPALLWNAGAALCAALTGIAVSFIQNQKTGGDNMLLTDRQTQLAGAELGFWKCVGATFNVIGISLTTASQAGFCVQMTTLIVPFLEFFAGVNIPGRVWAACLIAVAGVGAITLDSVSVASPELAQTILIGDMLCVLAAVFYATFDVRLNYWEKKVDKVDIVTGKMLSQTICSFVVAGALALVSVSQMEEIASFFSNVGPEELSIILVVMVWNGCFVNYLATYIQVPSQAVLGPSKSQIIYSANPLMSALLSFVILGESFSARGLVGGAAFIFALLIASTGPSSDEQIEG